MWDVPKFFISELPYLPKCKTALHIRHHLFKFFTSQENTCTDCVYFVQRQLPFFMWWIREKFLPHIGVKHSVCHANLFSDQLSYGCITAFGKRPGSLIWRLWAPISKVLGVKMSELFANFYACFFILHLFGSQNWFLQYFDHQTSIVLQNLR